MRAYPDACILIYLVEDRAHWAHAVLERVLPDHRAGPELVFSELTRLECRLQPLRSGNTLVLQAFDTLFATSGYSFQMLDHPSFELATRLRAEHRLKIPDALHLAAAISAGWSSSAAMRW